MDSTRFGELVEERNVWVAHNFPSTDSRETVLGVIEELGELAHSHLKQRQNIRGSAADHVADGKDAVGDLIVYLLGAMAHVGVPKNTEGFRLKAVADPMDMDTIFELTAAIGGLVVRRSEYDIEMVIRGCMQYCHQRGWDFDAIVEETWAKVSKRDWQADPVAGGEDISPEGRKFLMED
jgi:hypothetical protein